MSKLTLDTVETPIYTVAKCLQELIVNSNFNDALQNIVNILADSLEIDRCYIIKAVGDNQCKTLFSSTPKVIKHYSSLNDNGLIDVGLYPEIHKVLVANRAFKVSVNNNVSKKLHALLTDCQLQSLLLIPVFSGKALWGAIGFGDTKNTRTWRNSEMELKSLASAIGYAIESNKITNEIKASNNVFNSALSSLNEILWEVDLVDHTTQLAGSHAFIERITAGDETKDIFDWIRNNIHPLDNKRIFEKVKNFLTRENDSVEEEVCRVFNRQAGKYFWMHSRFKLKKSPSGTPIAITGSSTDITASKEVAFELEQQKEQYQFLVQSVGQVIFSIDKDGLFTHVSDAWRSLMQFAIAETIGTPFIKYLDHVHVQDFWMKMNTLLAGNIATIDEQVQMVSSKGNTVWVRVLAKNVRDTNNDVVGIFGTLENITHQYNEALLLKENNDKISTILNSSTDIILTINLERNTIENVNDAIAVLGYTPKEWIGQNYKSWTDDQRHKFHELMKLAVQSELQVSNKQISFENKLKTENIPFEFSSSIFYYKDQKYLLCVLRDIRERLKYEKNITRISTQLSNLINNIDNVYAIYDVDSNSYDFVSDNVQALYGCDKDNYLGDTLLWKTMVLTDDLPTVENAVEHILQNTGKGEIFYRIITPQGELKVIQEKLVISKKADGRADKIYIVKTDYTHIETARQTLIETEKKFRFISENISDVISIHDPDWNFTYASPSIKNILGYEPEEVLGLGAFDLVHPDDMIRTLDEALQPIVVEKKETQLRYRMRAKDGSYKWVETYSKPVIDAHGETASIISSTRDVTDRVIAENKLKESEAQYRLLSENSSDLISIHNLKGEFVYVSLSCTQVLGYEPAELLGKRPSDVLCLDEEELKKYVDSMICLLQQKQPLKFLNKIKTKKGEEKVIEVSVQPIIKDNELVAIQAASRDVTEREKLLAELEQSLTKERELNELRSMFVSTASHQFRTPLTVIQSGVEIMEMYLEELTELKQQKFQRQFNKIKTEIERLQYLMSDVLLLGRANAARTPFAPVTADLVAFCKEIIENKYNSNLPEDRHVVFSIAGEPQLVDFDPKLLGHAIENIISNAYKYSSEGNLLLDITFDDEVQISISDKGIGIPSEDLKNLFQPFYRATNTDEIEGTGLGLAIVKEFVEKHSGKINVDSIVNKGTTFCVTLPVKQNII